MSADPETKEARFRVLETIDAAPHLEDYQRELLRQRVRTRQWSVGELRALEDMVKRQGERWNG